MYDDEQIDMILRLTNEQVTEIKRQYENLVRLVANLNAAGTFKTATVPCSWGEFCLQEAVRMLRAAEQAELEGIAALDLSRELSLGEDS